MLINLGGITMSALLNLWYNRRTLPTEVTVMNTLTVNLHLLMVSFIVRRKLDAKLFVREKAFPSDQYMFQSQVDFHGYASDDAIVENKT
jgi:kynureninase